MFAAGGSKAWTAQLIPVTQKLRIFWFWFCSAMERANVYFVARQKLFEIFLVCFFFLAGSFWVTLLKSGCVDASGRDGHSSHRQTLTSFAFTGQTPYTGRFQDVSPRWIAFPPSTWPAYSSTQYSRPARSCWRQQYHCCIRLGRQLLHDLPNRTVVASRVQSSSTQQATTQSPPDLP